MHTIDLYTVDGPEPVWVLMVTLLAKYVAVWLGAKLPPLRAAAATLLAIIASTIVGLGAEVLLLPFSVTALTGLFRLFIVSLIETLLVGYGFAHGVTLRIASFIVGSNLIWLAASWISLTH